MLLLSVENAVQLVQEVAHVFSSGFHGRNFVALVIEDDSLDRTRHSRCASSEHLQKLLELELVNLEYWINNVV